MLVMRDTIGELPHVSTAKRLASRSAGQKYGKASAPSKKWEVLPINGARLLVKQTDGQEVIYQIDLSTFISGDIRPGNRIKANVNEVEGEKYVLSINKAD